MIEFSDYFIMNNSKVFFFFSFLIFLIKGVRETIYSIIPCTGNENVYKMMLKLKNKKKNSRKFDFHFYIRKIVSTIDDNEMSEIVTLMNEIKIKFKHKNTKPSSVSCTYL